MSVAGEHKITEIFNEVNKLLRKNGQDNALQYLRMLNNKRDNNIIPVYLSIYEYMISCICEEYVITKHELFRSTIKHKTTDARRTFYVMLSEHFKWSHVEISNEIKKSRSIVTMSIGLYDEMKNEANPTIYKYFFDKHNAIEKKVLDFATELNKKSGINK